MKENEKLREVKHCTGCIFEKFAALYFHGLKLVRFKSRAGCFYYKNHSQYIWFQVS
jgi:hypothetical protein